MEDETSADYGARFDVADNAPDFTLQRFQEFDSLENGIVWKIRVHHPDRRIDRCNVWYDNIQLRLWDSNDAYYIRTIEAGGGANFVIPASTNVSNDGIVSIKAFKTAVKNERFEDIEVSKA